MNIIKELLESKGIVPFRAGTSHGGEYHSSCPGCGDGSPRRKDQGPSDRFQIWPEKPEGVVYWCRICGAHGDCIQFLIDFDGKTFREACAYLGINPSGGNSAKCRPVTTPKPPIQASNPSVDPHTYEMPSEEWTTKATAFADWCHQQLLTSEEGKRMLAGRGLTMETAIRYRIGFNPGENGDDLRRSRKAWGLPEIKKENGKLKALWLPRGLVIPLLGADGRVIQIRIRRRAEDVAAFATNLPYQLIEGSCHATMVLEPQARAFVVVESGLDAYLCAQEGKGVAGAVTTWNAQAHPDAAACDILDQALRILVALDNDHAGNKHSPWWLARFHQARRWPVLDHKDPGDAFAAGASLRCWITAGLPPAITISADPVVDRADLVCNFGGGAEIEAGAGEKVEESVGANEVAKQEMAPTDNPGEWQDDLAVLEALLKKNPVRVLKSRGGHEVRIQWPPSWRHANMATASRISDLVFKSDLVTMAIHRHPAMVIHAGNLLTGGKA